jgi:hypothetical protein
MSDFGYALSKTTSALGPGFMVPQLYSLKVLTACEIIATKSCASQDNNNENCKLLVERVTKGVFAGTQV